MDSDLVLTECFSRRILRFTTSPIDLINSERVSSSTSSFLAHYLAYASHASMIISKFWCHENETGSLNFGPRWSYGDLVYKLRRVKGEANFISSGSKIVKRLRHRQYDPAIIERTIGLVLGPFTALYRSFLKRCTLTNEAVETIWRALSKPPQRRQGPDPRPLWLLVGTPSAFGPELAYRLRVAQPTLMDVARYFWYTLILLYMFVYYSFMTSPLWLAVGPQSI